MSDVFCPEGFIPVEAAILKVANRWFPESLEKAVPQLATSDSNIDAAVQALRQLKRAEWPWGAFGQTVARLRNYLHQGAIKAYYFSKDGLQPIGQDFWATSEADAVLETGFYWLNGEPSIIDERPPTPLFFMQSELDGLFSKPQGKKKPFPENKKLELIEALRKQDLHPTAQARRDAVQKMPEFLPYKITDKIFREAERQAPRKRGRPAANSGKQSRQES